MLCLILCFLLSVVLITLVCLIVLNLNMGVWFFWKEKVLACC